MNGGPAKVYPFFSHEKRCASVGVREACLHETPVSILEIDVAQKTNVLNLVEDSKADFRKTTRADAFAAMIRMHIDTFEVGNVIGLGHDVRLEDQFAILNHYEDSLFLDPSRDPFYKAFTVANGRVYSALEQSNFRLCVRDHLKFFQLRVSNFPSALSYQKGKAKLEQFFAASQPGFARAA